MVVHLGQNAQHVIKSNKDAANANVAKEAAESVAACILFPASRRVCDVHKMKQKSSSVHNKSLVHQLSLRPIPRERSGASLETGRRGNGAGDLALVAGGVLFRDIIAVDSEVGTKENRGSVRVSLGIGLSVLLLTVGARVHAASEWKLWVLVSQMLFFYGVNFNFSFFVDFVFQGVLQPLRSDSTAWPRHCHALLLSSASRT